ncbi:hypothetical protein [Cupriavidus sp. CuC1]|uniref:hypothetical protein n=1 Tax=Cupriavidus sp. CuC1 TaxID=3373131 RepID=UPI0037D3C98B
MKNDVRFEIPVELDLSPDKRMRIYSLVREIINTRDRAADELNRMCLLLLELKDEMENHEFTELARVTLQISRGSLYRYLRTGASARTMIKGMEDPRKLLTNTTARALQLLYGADEDVLNEVRERAMRGEATNETLVKDLINAQHNLEERLDDAKEQISSQERQLSAKDSHIAQLEKQRNESRLAELETSNVATERLSRIETLSRDICEHEAELERLRAEIERLRVELEQGHVVEKVVVVEKVPDNFRNMEDAIADRNRELDRVTQQLEATARKLADAEAERVLLTQTQGVDGDILQLQSDLQGFCEKLSATLLLKHSFFSEQARLTVLQMGSCLLALTTTIQEYCSKGQPS